MKRACAFLQHTRDAPWTACAFARTIAQRPRVCLTATCSDSRTSRRPLTNIASAERTLADAARVRQPGGGYRAMCPADALVVAPSSVAYRAVTSRLVVLRFAQPRRTVQHRGLPLGGFLHHSPRDLCYDGPPGASGSTFAVRPSLCHARVSWLSGDRMRRPVSSAHSCRLSTVTLSTCADTLSSVRPRNNFIPLHSATFGVLPFIAWTAV
jgi:hypothetical protein